MTLNEKFYKQGKETEKATYQEKRTHVGKNRKRRKRYRQRQGVRCRNYRVSREISLLLKQSENIKTDAKKDI